MLDPSKKNKITGTYSVIQIMDRVLDGEGHATFVSLVTMITCVFMPSLLHTRAFIFTGETQQLEWLTGS